MNMFRIHISGIGVLGALAYPALFLILYFSLAIHLRLALGKWPESIGVDPGTTLFSIHATAARLFFSVAFFALPCLAGLTIIFAFNPPTRKAAIYLFILLISCGLAFGATHLAPSGFSNWWWD